MPMTAPQPKHILAGPERRNPRPCTQVRTRRRQLSPWLRNGSPAPLRGSATAHPPALCLRNRSPARASAPQPLTSPLIGSANTRQPRSMAPHPLASPAPWLRIHSPAPSMAPHPLASPSPYARHLGYCPASASMPAHLEPEILNRCAPAPDIQALQFWPRLLA